MSHKKCSKYVLYTISSCLPPRIRRVTLKQIYYKYNRFTVYFIHPAFYLLYKLVTVIPIWRLRGLLAGFLVRLSGRLFPGSYTVILRG